MGLGPFGASASLFLRNGELLGHSPICKWSDQRNQEKNLMIILVLVGSNMRIVLSTCGNVDVVQNLFDFGILKNWEI